MPRTENTAKERIVALLAQYPEQEFTTRQIAEALNMKMNSTSAFISGYFPFIPIAKVGETKHSGGGWTPTYKYAPEKVLAEGSPSKAKSSKRASPHRPLPARQDQSLPAFVVDGGGRRMQLHNDNEEESSYAKVVFQDDRMVVLVTAGGEVIRGKVMRE